MDVTMKNDRIYAAFSAQTPPRDCRVALQNSKQIFKQIGGFPYFLQFKSEFGNKEPRGQEELPVAQGQGQ